MALAAAPPVFRVGAPRCPIAPAGGVPVGGGRAAVAAGAAAAGAVAVAGVAAASRRINCGLGAAAATPSGPLRFGRRRRTPPQGGPALVGVAEAPLAAGARMHLAAARAVGAAPRLWSRWRRATLLPRCRASAAAEAPAALSAVATGRRSAWSILLVVVYIICDISVYVVGDRATHGYTTQTVLFSSAFISMCVGLVASAVRRGSRGVRDCVDVGNVLRLLPVSASFGLSMLCMLMAFQSFDGAFIKLLGQMKLPLTAVFSAVLLGRRYTAVQWQLIFLICVACTSFTALKMSSVTVGSVSIVGLVCVTAWVLFNVLATLFSERAFKEAQALPFMTLMTNLRIGELLAMMVTLAFVPGFHVRHFFRGWDFSTVMVLATLVGDSWLSALMVKQLSSVTTKISKCCSLVVLYAAALASGKQPFVVSQALGAFMIVEATALFATVSFQGDAPAKAEAPRQNGEERSAKQPQPLTP